jgi:hypothetical protein
MALTARWGVAHSALDLNWRTRRKRCVQKPHFVLFVEVEMVEGLMWLQHVMAYHL